MTRDVAVESHSEESTRLCCSCGQLLPLHQFRRRKSDSNKRQSECCSCHAKRERDRSRSRRLVAVDEFVAKAGQISSDKRRVIALTRGITHRMGGLDGLVRSLMDCYDRARANGDLETQLKFFAMVARLVQVAESIERQAHLSQLQYPRLHG